MTEHPLHDKFAVFNPHNKPVDELPYIFGWNNGGSPGWLMAQLITQDGKGVGGHICSHEGFMLGDLGILEGTRPDRHKTFQQHYPDGYRMIFVKHDDERLDAAIELNKNWQEKDDEV